MPLIVAGGMIVTMDENERVLAHGTVHIDGNAITRVDAGTSSVPEGSDVLHASGGIVMPGLLNAHTHSPETLARGCVDRVTHENWFARVWPMLDRLTPSQIRIAVLLGCAEMLHSGTTAVVDHFRQTPLTIEAVRAAVTAYQEAGMRAAVALMVRDRVVPPWVKDPGDPVSVCRAALDEFTERDGRVSLMLAPSAPDRCTDELLKAVSSLSRKRGVGIHMHVDETKAQYENAIGIYGHSSVRQLQTIGLLDERVSLAHCVWITGDDLDLVARHGAAVVHNPISNLRLGSGIAPVPEMLARGIHVTLGSDGAASNDSQNMFEVMKMASLLPGARAVHSERPTVRDILAMTTGDAARRFGMPGTGVLAAGRKADLIVLEGDDARLHPLNDAHRQILFGGPGLRVRHAVIDGRVVLRDGRILTFDEAAVLEAADDIRTALH